MSTPITNNDEPVKVENDLWDEFVSGLCSQLTPLEISNPKDKVTIVRPFMTTLRNQSAAVTTNPFRVSMAINPRKEKYVESTGRSRYFCTKVLPYPDIVSKIQETMSKETINVSPDPPYFFDGTGRISTYIDKNDLPQYRAHAMHLHSFKTFLKELDVVQAEAQHDPSFLVITPCLLLAYPTILPLFMNYGLQLVEPHYTFTAYLGQNKNPIYFLKKKKVYRYSSQSYVMKTKFYENILNSIVNDQAKLSHGYVMSGFSYVFNHSHDSGYNLLRNIVSNHHRPDCIIYVLIPEDVMNDIPGTLAFDPTTNYTILLYNYLYFKQTIADKYFEGRILQEDHVPKSAPFCYTTENGNVKYVTLLEWKPVKPKTIMLFQAINMITDEGVEFFEQAGIAPDFIILFTRDEYDFDFDLGNYLYERLYASFFTKTFPAKTFTVLNQTVELEEILEWFNLEPDVPYFVCKYDRLPPTTKKKLLEGRAESGKEWLLQISWGDDSIKRANTYYGIRQGYYMKHIDSPVPSLGHLSKLADSGVTPIDDKLSLNDMEGRIEYFQNMKKLPLRMRYGDATYMMRSKIAIYKFLNNPMYRKLQWAWWTKAHILIAGQPICGARYVGTALAMVLKAPHIYYDAIYKSALAVKRVHNHCFYLESCWKRIWFYKWGIYTEIEVERFKYFLPWAIRRVRYVRGMASKGMNEPSINDELSFRCYYPYYRLSRAQRLNMFPRLKFAIPDLEPKYFRWDEGILEGYVRILDLIMLYVLNIECPPLFLAKLIYYAPKPLLPDVFIIDHPREMFLCANILHEFYYRQKETPRALEESKILNQAIYQAMAKYGNVPGEGWVVSGIKIYPNFVKRLSEEGIQHKIIYITDPTFHLFQMVYVGDTLKQTATLGEYCICPNEFLRPETDNRPGKCLCTDYVTAYSPINVCKNITLPKAMTDRSLANPAHSPIWDMPKNVSSFPGRKTMCFYDHPNLNYHDHLPVRFIQMKLPGWKRTYFRRYVFDYFFKKASIGNYPNLNIELRTIRPRKFTEMFTEISADHIGGLKLMMNIIDHPSKRNGKPHITSFLWLNADQYNELKLNYSLTDKVAANIEFCQKDVNVGFYAFVNQYQWMSMLGLREIFMF